MARSPASPAVVMSRPSPWTVWQPISENITNARAITRNNLLIISSFLEKTVQIHKKRFYVYRQKPLQIISPKENDRQRFARMQGE